MDKEADNIAYIDEPGCKHRVNSAYGWAKRGQKVYGELTGKREPRRNLIAARRGKRTLAPILIAGSINFGFSRRTLISSLSSYLMLLYL